MAHKSLYAKASKWQASVKDERDSYPYIQLLNELTFQAELRFCDYLQYQEDGLFLARLSRWLENVSAPRHQQALFQLLAHLLFIDELQMNALYRDAYRRIICPWLRGGSFAVGAALDSDFFDQQRALLATYALASITESFDVTKLLKVNDLHGLRRPTILGQSKQRVLQALKELPPDLNGCIICEDVVGTGKQAGKILKIIEDFAPGHWRLVFVPLITFQQGASNILSQYVTRTSVQPVVTIPERCCLRKEPVDGEPEVFKIVRGIVQSTAFRVLEKSDGFDDPPKEPFGYKGIGGLLVTCHNAPNNTLPIVHHRAPSWTPLFRRLHHKDHI